MNSPLVLLSICLLAHRLSAQLPAAPPLAGSYKGEARFGLASSPAHRVSVLTGAVTPRGTGTLSGPELFARASNVGLYVRSLSGAFDEAAQGVGKSYKLQEARLMLGSTGLSVEGGVIRRTATSEVSPGTPKEQTIWRGGARSQWDIGGSGIQVTLNAGGRFTNVKGVKDKTLKFLGFDAEATLLAQAPKNLPIYALAGWRYERFDDPWATTVRTEEVTGPFFGIGVRFAVRPKLN